MFQPELALCFYNQVDEQVKKFMTRDWKQLMKQVYSSPITVFRFWCDASAFRERERKQTNKFTHKWTNIQTF